MFAITGKKKKECENLVDFCIIVLHNKKIR